MDHILDNPIWHALNTGNSQFAFGNDQAKCIDREIGVFAGLKHNSQQDFEALRNLTPAGNIVVLFTPGKITIPDTWQVELEKEILQMVQTKPQPVSSTNCNIVALQEQHVPAMLELTALTKPGPFLRRTIKLGNYEGIFSGTDLVAMAGQRMQPLPYIEISAVCTHPAHTGKGYAAALVSSQTQNIWQQACTPFLHVYSDNHAACKLYERLGFQTRREMLVYVLKKKG